MDFCPKWAINVKFQWENKPGLTLEKFWGPLYMLLLTEQQSSQMAIHLWNKQRALDFSWTCSWLDNMIFFVHFLSKTCLKSIHSPHPISTAATTYPGNCGLQSKVYKHLLHLPPNLVSTWPVSPPPADVYLKPFMPFHGTENKIRTPHQAPGTTGSSQTHGLHSLTSPIVCSRTSFSLGDSPQAAASPGRAFCLLQFLTPSVSARFFCSFITYQVYNLPSHFVCLASVSSLSPPFQMEVLDFPGGASDKESTCQCRTHKRCGFNPWVGKIPWRRARQPTPVFWPRESHGQRSLAGYYP